MAKIRKGVEVLDAGGGIKFNGVGGLEVCESRAFVGGVIDGLRYGIHSLLRFLGVEDLLMLCVIDESHHPRNKRNEKRMLKIGRMDMEGRKMMMMRCYNRLNSILQYLWKHFSKSLDESSLPVPISSPLTLLNKPTQRLPHIRPSISHQTHPAIPQSRNPAIPTPDPAPKSSTISLPLISLTSPQSITTPR